ncbi:MAG: hypothetical protein CSA23_08195 [Deltaproteobacteria bacterium]|nr:MAG: hypothetical protein CSA23_08195 [Deltaproteobacteria bacterium]
MRVESDTDDSEQVDLKVYYRNAERQRMIQDRDHDGRFEPTQWFNRPPWSVVMEVDADLNGTIEGIYEGRVTIRFVFVLETDGSVRDVAVTKEARHKSLNGAALDAVHRAATFPRPPSNLFKGALPLELTIVFELT